GGILFVLLFLVHGSLWLVVKSAGAPHDRAVKLVPKLWAALLVVAVIFLLVSRRVTFLYDNYLNNPILFVIPALAVIALIMIRVYIAKGAWWQAWFASCITIVGTTLFGVVGLYPKLLPSSIDPAYSLTAFNSSSSPLTLKIMLGVALTFVPIVIAYQVWVHHLFRHKTGEEDLEHEEGY
ncbi:MAG: cytochrome d ubiquinol oxidase subunit II, partial [Syntrophales bacterium]|nr:cytochrome d ubiquinol oxidase subunit II [Syntrophales bacterium]